MMGLLGNVAEVKQLRYRLMTSEYIQVFSDLLDSTSDGIEVSYNAAGVLAHIASDGAEAWTITQPSRVDVLNRLIYAVDRWSLNAERNINYRSFEPILGLISCSHTPACQIWAVWALANLTQVSLFSIICIHLYSFITILNDLFSQVYPDKYCKLVEDENGIKLLMDLIDNIHTPEKLRELAQQVLSHCDANNAKHFMEE